MVKMVTLSLRGHLRRGWPSSLLASRNSRTDPHRPAAGNAIEEDAVARTRLQKAAALRNLLRRPARPALGRGRLQILCRRALLTHGGTISTSTAIEWCYPQLRWQPKRKNAFNVAVRQALTVCGCCEGGAIAEGSQQAVVVAVARTLNCASNVQ